LVSRPHPTLWAVLAGLLLVASVPPWGWWPTAFLGIALLDRLIANQPVRNRFWRTTTVSAAWLFPGTLWMWDLSIPGWILASTLHCLYFGIAVSLVPPNKGRRIGLVAAISIAEFIRWNFPFGGAPLATLAMGQAAGPLAPIVRVGGPLMLTITVAIVGIGLSAIADGRQATKKSAVAVTASVMTIVIASILTAIAPTGNVLKQIEVALVQGGGPQRTRATPTSAAVVFEKQLEANHLVKQPVDLVLWPENVVNPSPYPATGKRQSTRLYADDADTALRAEARRLDAILIPGWFHRHPTISEANLNYSTAIEPNGTVAASYEKVRTVPFGEFVPLRSIVGKFTGSDIPLRDVLPGTEPPVLETSKGTLGINISWEIFFEQRTRDAVNNGAQLILNPTNGASYWLTMVQSQQVASGRLRALETGRWLLQSAPTGFSAVIDPQGHVVKRTGISEQEVLHATVELREGKTWATRVGPWPILAISLCFLGGALIAARRQE